MILPPDISDNNGNKMSAIIGSVAYWTVMPDSWFYKAGIVILELQRDYYSLGKNTIYTGKLSCYES